LECILKKWGNRDLKEKRALEIGDTAECDNQRCRNKCEKGPQKRGIQKKNARGEKHKMTTGRMLGAEEGLRCTTINVQDGLRDEAGPGGLARMVHQKNGAW